MDWRKVWVVARHEYLANVRRAGFIIMTAIVPVLGIVVLLIGTLFSGQARQLGAFFERQFEVGDQAIGVVDSSGYFSPILPEYEEDFVVFGNEEEAETALEAEEVSKVLVIEADYLETGRVVVVSVGSGFSAAAVSDSGRVQAFLVDHLLAGQVDPALQQQPVLPPQDGPDPAGRRCIAAGIYRALSSGAVGCIPDALARSSIHQRRIDADGIERPRRLALQPAGPGIQ